MPETDVWTPYPSIEAPSPDLTISVNAGNPEDITERVLRPIDTLPQ